MRRQFPFLPHGIGLLVLCLALPGVGRAAESPAGIDRQSAAGHDDAYVYRLPYRDGSSFPVIQAYGSRFSHRGAEHYTVDFRMDEGTPVLSARDGIVTEVESAQVTGCWSDGCGRYANRVVVRHADGTLAKYFHLAPGSALVSEGQRVIRGQLLAHSGNTGLSTTPHLHFGVYVVVDGGALQSIPVRFETRGGAVEPRQGRRYLHPATARAVASFAGAVRAPPAAPVL